MGGIRVRHILLCAALAVGAAPNLSGLPQGKVKNVTLTVGGERVAALYWLPAAKAGAKVPGVILLHMLFRTKDDWRSFGDALERNGYAALAVDLRNSGNAGKEKLVADARAAFEFLQKQPEVDPQRLAVVGASIGANGALWFAVEEPSVRCAALLSPGLNYRGIATEPAIAQMKRPVLLVSSEEDSYSTETVRRLESLAAGPKAVKMYNGAGHGTQILDAGVGLEKEILAFFKAHL